MDKVKERRRVHVRACRQQAISKLTDRDIDDLLDISDTEGSSSSSNTGVFETQHFVLDLHEMVKDDPNPNPEQDPKQAKLKVRKNKRRKRSTERSRSSISSESITDTTSVPPLSIESTKEEFYDAHESYHTLPENQVSNSTAPAAVTALVVAHSEHGNDPKAQALAELGADDQGQSVAAQKEPSTITKPVTGPE